MFPFKMYENIIFLFLVYRADLTENTKRYYVYFITLPICTVATAVKWMFKYGSEFLDVIRILPDSISFLSDIHVLSFLIQVLAVVRAAK